MSGLNKIKQRRRTDFLLLLGIICAISVLLCLLAYRVDNKYTILGPRGHKGILILAEKDIQNQKPIFLVTGWEYYSGRLLTPEDFVHEQPVPDQYVFIGQYGGLEAGDLSADPHGSASYRLTVSLPSDSRSYMLELPEIFSAYKAYVNGKLIMYMGDPAPESYRPETGNRFAVFEAAGSAEILIAVSDFSHLYSGMVYPPAFGTPETVSSILYARFLFRALLCACTLTIGLLAMLVGVLSRRMARTTLFTFLCLFYVGYACYPVTQSLIGGSRFLYAAENFSFCAMLLVVMLLVQVITGLQTKWNIVFLLFGASTCLASLSLPFALTAGSLPAMRGYSWLISFYEWGAAGYVVYATLWGVLKNREHARPILCGAVAFTTALVMDRVLPLHEPIFTGWFVELFSFLLILSVSGAIGQDVSTQYRDRVALKQRAGHMELLLSLQQTHYGQLQNEIEEIKTLQHDMRHHFNMIDGFIKTAHYEDLDKYVASFGAGIPEHRQTEYARNHIINVLASHYAYAARQYGIHYDFRCDVVGPIAMPDAELCGLLSNLLENAVEACQRIQTRETFIRVAVAQLGRILSIRLENSANAGLQPFENGFLSAKDEARTGYGLASIKTIARRYDGTAEFSWDRAKQMFTSHITLLTNQVD